MSELIILQLTLFLMWVQIGISFTHYLLTVLLPLLPVCSSHGVCHCTCCLFCYPPSPPSCSWTASTPLSLHTRTWPRLSGTTCSLQLQTRGQLLTFQRLLCALLTQPSCTLSKLLCLYECTSVHWSDVAEAKVTHCMCIRSWRIVTYTMLHSKSFYATVV